MSRKKGSTRPEQDWRSFVNHTGVRSSWDVTVSQLETGITSILAFERDEPYSDDLYALQTLRRRMQAHRDIHHKKPIISFMIRTDTINYFQEVCERNKIDVRWMRHFDQLSQFQREITEKFEGKIDGFVDGGNTSEFTKEAEEVF